MMHISKWSLVFILVLIFVSVIQADEELPRGPVTVARDIVSGGTSTSNVTMATPVNNTFYLVETSFVLHNSGSSNGIELEVTYTNVLGVSTTTQIVNMNDGGSGIAHNGTELINIYAKASSPVSMTANYTGTTGSYDLDAILVKQ